VQGCAAASGPVLQSFYSAITYSVSHYRVRLSSIYVPPGRVVVLQHRTTALAAAAADDT